MTLEGGYTRHPEQSIALTSVDLYTTKRTLVSQGYPYQEGYRVVQCDQPHAYGDVAKASRELSMIGARMKMEYRPPTRTFDKILPINSMFGSGKSTPAFVRAKMSPGHQRPSVPAPEERTSIVYGG